MFYQMKSGQRRRDQRREAEAKIHAEKCTCPCDRCAPSKPESPLEIAAWLGLFFLLLVTSSFLMMALRTW